MNSNINNIIVYININIKYIILIFNFILII